MITSVLVEAVLIGLFASAVGLGLGVGVGALLAQAFSSFGGGGLELAGLGVPAAAIVEPADDAAQFDSESLWEQLRRRDWHGQRVQIVRGDGGRDWLAQTLREAGAQVDHVAAYRRVAPALDEAEAAQLRAAIDRPESHLWFFSSSEAIDNLAVSPIVAGGAPVDWTRAAALATHPRIAARARQLGFARVTEARPALAAVIACIQSIRP
jgi:uroporphyrinogen-III synthase